MSYISHILFHFSDDSQKPYINSKISTTETINKKYLTYFYVSFFVYHKYHFKCQSEPQFHSFYFQIRFSIILISQNQHLSLSWKLTCVRDKKKTYLLYLDNALTSMHFSYFLSSQPTDMMFSNLHINTQNVILHTSIYIDQSRTHNRVHYH